MAIKKDSRLNIKKIAVSRIFKLIYGYRTKYNLDTIKFKENIDGITHWNIFIYHGDNGEFKSSFFYFKGETLLKILKVLDNLDFIGLKNGEIVEITE